MTDVRRPNASYQTQLRASIYADDTEIKVLSLNGFNPQADKQIGDEFVRCTEFGVDASGWPVMRGCKRGVAQEDGGSEPRPWPGGTPIFEVGWTMVDIVDELPEPTPEMVGRQFNYRDAAGDVYTFNVVTSPEGTPVIDWVNEPPGEDDETTLSLAAFFATGAGEPHGIAVDGSGNLWVTDRATDTLNKFGPTGTLLGTFGSTGGGNGQFESPRGVAVDASNNVWVVDAGNDRLQRFTNAGAYSTQVGASGSGNGQFDSPADVAIDGSGNLYVADANNHRVQKFTSAGAYVSQFGSLGTGDGQFNGPASIAIAPDGSIWILDEHNSRVQKFSAAHAHLLTAGSDGNADGQFQDPEGIAVDGDGNVWVTDADQHRVQVFDENGVFLAKIGAFGSGTAQLKSPRHLVFDPADIGYVVDTENDRVSTVRIVPPGITPVITTRSATSASIPNNTNGGVTVSCLAGEVVVGGGFVKSVNAGVVEYENYPSSATAWTVSVRNVGGSSTTVTAYARCLATPLVEG